MEPAAAPLAGAGTAKAVIRIVPTVASNALLNSMMFFLTQGGPRTARHVSVWSYTPADKDSTCAEPEALDLRPDGLVHLTEGDMMDPEASVSALVFHHPDARYFGV